MKPATEHVPLTDDRIAEIAVWGRAIIAQQKEDEARCPRCDAIQTDPARCQDCGRHSDA